MVQWLGFGACNSYWRWYNQSHIFKELVSTNRTPWDWGHFGDRHSDGVSMVSIRKQGGYSEKSPRHGIQVASSPLTVRLWPRLSNFPRLWFLIYNVRVLGCSLSNPYGPSKLAVCIFVIPDRGVHWKMKEDSAVIWRCWAPVNEEMEIVSDGSRGVL